jgi:hypothetical protein
LQSSVSPKKSPPFQAKSAAAGGGSRGGQKELSVQSAKRPAKDFLATLKEAEDLMTSLSLGLSKGTYECMICYDTVKPDDKIWSCVGSCYAVFHHKVRVGFSIDIGFDIHDLKNFSFLLR